MRIVYRTVRPIAILRQYRSGPVYIKTSLNLTFQTSPRTKCQPFCQFFLTRNSTVNLIHQRATPKPQPTQRRAKTSQCQRSDRAPGARMTRSATSLPTFEMAPGSRREIFSSMAKRRRCLISPGPTLIKGSNVKLPCGSSHL